MSAPDQAEWQRICTARIDAGRCASCTEPVDNWLDHGDGDDGYTCTTVWFDEPACLTTRRAGMQPVRRRRPAWLFRLRMYGRAQMLWRRAHREGRV